MHRRLLLLYALLALGATPALAKEQIVDGLAAQVGSRIVLISEVMQLVGPQEAQLREAGAPMSEIHKLRANGLERMIEQRLIEEVVRRRELYASDEEVDRAIQGIADENGITLEQLYASVAFHGMSREEYRQQLKTDIERRNVIHGMLGPKIQVDEAMARQLYAERFKDQPTGGEAVHVRQLLVTYGEGRGKEAACDEVQSALVRIRGGEEFEALAREISEVAPTHGGDIGWVHLDSAAAWMKDALADLEPGDTSEVLVLPFDQKTGGCSLLHLVERRQYTPITFEGARDRLMQEAYEIELEKAYKKWIEELREQTYIERRGYFADAARFGEPVLSGGAPRMEESALP
jgi:peptidyl-prolyl cis-trans isomerase SurA